MTLEEKIAQLGSVWMGATGGGDGVAPMQDMFSDDLPPLDELVKDGLGQLTRVFGTRPVEPADGMRALAGLQEKIVAASRFGIPAVAHEECLTGFAAWRATVFPAPPAWGAAFDPGLVREMARSFGAGMRAVGVHQGLAPVLDVTRDPRWGRTEESIGEDPYLVGTIGAAYVSGLQEAGPHATLKHFAGYSAGKAGRNMAPVQMGPREFADVILPPFEMGIRAGARSVMPAYNDIDGVPASADPELLTRLLRGRLGFDGLLVSDYYAVSFLQTQHRLAASPGGAAGLALSAGLDVELPSVRCYGRPLREAALAGDVPAEVIDRAAARVLTAKCELGLLDPDWVPVPAAGPRPAAEPPQAPDLDSPASRGIARRLAEESVVLLANHGGILPLAPGAKVAVVGPLADDKLAFFGCYSMPRHLGPAYPEAADGVEVTTVLGALRAALGDVAYARGCAVTGSDESGFDEAVARVRSADVVVGVVGDVAGLFGRGTSGEGCDAPDLRLPGVQEKLLHALADSGRPVVAVLVTGRPYAIGSVAPRLAAVVQAFFPGEEGGNAIAGVLTGRVNPSGKLPMEIPGAGSPQPSTYLRTANAARHDGSSVDPTPLFAFGHGMSYTTFAYADLALSAASIPADAVVDISCTVRNTGPVAGDEVVQLYLSDPVAQVVRPLRWLAGFARVALAPGQAK
ncbi:MAG: glycoside hydrolase family 3 C-terminal domain-containing protein, partial [Nocardiopsaceae bacterium]|nr:glycoside hydrolase family 3 C-terminal domain-containing protein [Nocardiopsaceae bacterium]